MNKPKQGRGSTAVLVTVAILVVLPILYVLAIGPTAWIYENGNLSDSTKNTLESCYTPVFLLAEAFPPFGDAIFWYVSFWD